MLAITQQELLPSVIPKTSAFTFSCLKAILKTTITKISRFNNAAYNLDPSGFGLPLPGLPADFTTDLVANQVELPRYCEVTHWVTLLNFILRYAEIPTVWAFLAQ